MLVLTRKSGQKLLLGPDITLVVLEVNGDRVKVGVEAPRSIKVMRPEVLQQLAEENRLAAQAPPELRLLLGGLEEPPVIA